MGRYTYPSWCLAVASRIRELHQEIIISSLQTLMSGPLTRRRLWVALILAPSSVILIGVGSALALQAGWFRESLIRLMSKRAERVVQVHGALQFHVFSRHPRIVADDVMIGNPAWIPNGTAAKVGRLTLVVDWSIITGPLIIQSLTLDRATLHLLRNSEGQANWQWRDSLKGASGEVPLIHALSMRDATVSLEDERRRLRFQGIVTVDDRASPATALPLRVTATGDLNTRATAIVIDGASLATLSRDTPYAFAFSEQSSGSQIKGRGALRQPLLLNDMEGTVEASGANLHDLYFLTGVTMINTGEYRLSATFDRRGSLFTYKDIALAFGQSDVQGVVLIETVAQRPRMTATLESRRLRLADIGERAAGRATQPVKNAPLLLSNAMFNRASILRIDGAVKYRAREVVVGRYSLLGVAAEGALQNGVLQVSPLTADLLKGKLRSTVTIDARPEVPAVNVDIKMTALQLTELVGKTKSEPPLEGTVSARITIRGKGSSVHQVAASSEGNLTAVIPRGAVRSAFAELAGIDLRGLGMLLAKQTQTTAIRCGVASFEAHNGELTAQRLVLDTQDVLVTGEGRIQLDTEALDLRLLGHPKRMRLVRVRSPLPLQGTLLHPTIGVQARHSVGQAAGAVALGLVLTPLASILAFVDPGLAQDADCATLISTTRKTP